MKFYGRENELSALKSELQQIEQHSRLGVVTGRRHSTFLCSASIQKPNSPTLGWSKFGNSFIFRKTKDLHDSSSPPLSDSS